MKTRNLYFGLIIAATLCACQEIEQLPDANQGGDNVDIEDIVLGEGQIIAVAPSQSKITFGSAAEGAIPVIWNNVETDVIKVMSMAGEAEMDGQDYTLNAGYLNSGTAVFDGVAVDGTDRIAVFPSTRSKGLNADGNPEISFAVLNSQGFHSAITNNGGNLKYLPMWAKESEGSKFTFENLCGIVKFYFNDYQEMRDMKITTVSISSKSRYISGVAEVDKETGDITLTGTTDAQKTVTVNYPAGYAIKNTQTSLSYSETKENVKGGYLIGLPKGTYPAGDITVTFTDDRGRTFSREVTSELVINAGVVKSFPVLPFTFSYGTANSIIVEPGKSVTFDAAPRYTFGTTFAVADMKKVLDADGKDYQEADLKVETVWEHKESAGSLEAGTVISSVAIENNKITVTVGSSRGNALVALKDKEGTILWSWHIWVVDGLADQKYTNCAEQGSPTFMDRNLGATTKTYKSPNAKGLYYTYGRKDPFVVSKKVTYATKAPYLTADSELTGYEVRTASNSSMSWTIKNPDKRIIYTATPSTEGRVCFDNWLNLSNVSEVTKNWGNTAEPVSTIAEAKAAKGGYKTIYDPCPEGYRVPDYHYFSGLTTENGTTESDAGWNFDYDGTDDVAYYPNPGYLNMGDVEGTKGGVMYYNKRAYYWTTTLTSNRAAGFLVGNGSIYPSKDANIAMARPAACNIRCLKIE